MIRFQLLFIAIVLTASPVCTADSLQSIVEDYSHYHQNVRQTLDDEARRAADWDWLVYLKAGAATADVTSVHWTTAHLLLARLHVAVEQFASALPYFETIMDSNRAEAGTRLAAAKGAAEAAVLAGSDVDVVLKYTHKFEDLVNNFKATGTEYPETYHHDALCINLIRAELLEQTLYVMLQQIGNNLSRTQRAELEARYLAVASVYQQLHVELLLTQGAGYPELVDEMSLLAERGVELARMNDKVASLLHQSAPDDANAARKRTVAVLNQLRKFNGGSLLSHEAASYFLKAYFELIPAHASHQPYHDLAEALIDELSAGHGIINYLRDHGLRMSNQSSRRSDANKLFELVIKAEKQWFPSEYQNHVNYQWSKLAIARNTLRMHDLATAEQHLNSLQGTQLQGEYLQGEHAKLSSVLMQMMQTTDAQQEPLEPQLPVNPGTD